MSCLQDSGLEKTRLCKYYADGHCSNGSSCKFAHGQAELRTPDQAGSFVEVDGTRGEFAHAII